MSEAVQDARLRAGMRWLAWGSMIAIAGLTSWAILAAGSGSAAGMVAASSGNIAVIVAWTTGYAAIKTQLDRNATVPEREE